MTMERQDLQLQVVSGGGAEDTEALLFQKFSWSPPLEALKTNNIQYL